MSAQLEIAAPRFAERARCKPFLRWVGGKRALLPVLAPTAYAWLARTGGTYHEPFLGGGALALELGLPGMRLGDVVAPLVATYGAIRDDVAAVWAAYEALIARGWGKEAYYGARAALRAAQWQFEVRADALVGSAADSALAAHVLYLNATCFNGIYRTNRSGEFNTPWGMKDSKRAPAFRTREHLEEVSRALRTSILIAGDFSTAIDGVSRGDFVFCDPPYLTTFSTYSEEGFDLAAHERLAAAACAAHDRGAFVIVANADVPKVRELYAWADVIPTKERRSVNADGGGRGAVGCVLAVSDQAQLREDPLIAAAIDP